MIDLLNLRFRLLLAFGFIVFFAPGLFAQVNFNTYDMSKTDGETWLEFEPGEVYILDGSENFLNNQSASKYYPSVANFFAFFDKSENSLGVRITWSRWGSHYADIIPQSVVDNPIAFPMDDVVGIAIWVWSPGYQHELAAVLQRMDEIVYNLRIAKLDFRGWKKFHVPVPVMVRSAYRSSVNEPKKYFFKGFRVFSSSEDKVGDVYVFLDKMDVVKELYGSIYDGMEIEQILIKEKQERKATNSSSSP